MPNLPTKLTPYQLHKQSWSDCGECELCHRRERVVLSRGTIPCDVLFIGEAPGPSEDILGKPFVGPAGKLLDRIIEEAFGQFFSPTGANPDGEKSEYRKPSYALTNLVACIPLGDDGEKVSEPPAESIEACAPRLREFVKLCKPRLIVCVGTLSAKWVPKVVKMEIPRIEIIHPAAILRMNVAQRGLAKQKCVVTLTDALEDL